MCAPCRAAAFAAQFSDVHLLTVQVGFFFSEQPIRSDLKIILSKLHKWILIRNKNPRARRPKVRPLLALAVPAFAGRWCREGARAPAQPF